MHASRLLSFEWQDAGVEIGDIIDQVNGDQVGSADEALAKLKSLQPNSTNTFTFLRARAAE